MKSKTILGVVAAVVILGMVVIPAIAVNDGILGNGAPQAKLLGKLNIIGVDKDKNANMDNDGGSVIFVALGSTGVSARTKILLSVGDDFAVLDKNGTDGEASFQLPDPNLDPYIIGEPGDADTETAYSVFVRPLGKPGGWTTITTCAELLDSTFAGLLPQQATRILNDQPDEVNDPNVYCSIEQVGSEITLRTNGKGGKVSFTNVSAELLTIVFSVEIDIDADTTEEYLIRVPIFDPILQGEYWQYDNNGLKLLQVRFYDISTDVTDADLAYE